MNTVNPMNINKEALMKHFASILRARAMGKEKAPSISEDIVRYLSRKELIEVVKKKHKGSIPKDYNLVEMENVELVSLIEDEMHLISFITDKWSQDPVKINGTQVTPKTPLIPVKKEPTKIPNKKKNDGTVSK